MTAQAPVSDCEVLLVHLVKLLAGAKDLGPLKNHVAAAAGEPVLYISTRSTPKRAAEILDGGSLYWVVGGSVRARMPITSIETVGDGQGRSLCIIGLAPSLVETSVVPYRPFQGWRYLERGKAPADISDADDIPEHMKADLAALGLI